MSMTELEQLELALDSIVDKLTAEQKEALYGFVNSLKQEQKNMEDDLK